MVYASFGVHLLECYLPPPPQNFCTLFVNCLPFCSSIFCNLTAPNNLHICRLELCQRLIGEVVQSWRRPLLGPSPCWKRLLALKTLLRHYAKRALTPRSLNVKLGPRRNYHKGRAAIRHYANQTARPLLLLRRGPNFTLRDRGVNARLA